MRLSAQQNGRVIALAVMVGMAAWVPHAELGYPAWLVALRYAAYCGAAACLVWLGDVGRSTLRLVGHSNALLLLALVMAYWAVSMAWSDNPVFTLQKSLLAILTAAAVIAVVHDLSPRITVSTTVSVALVIVVIGALVAIAVPSVGVDQSDFHSGKWKGISSQKNAFGMLAASSAVLLLSPSSLLPTRIGGILPRATLLAICALCVWMSGSRGALANALVGAGAVLFFGAAKTVQRAVVVTVLAALPLGVFLLLASFRLEGDALVILGLDFETTGRIAIWRFGFEDLRGHELLGLGLGGFWVDSRVTAFESMYGWVLPNFHNGYISLVVETGFIGVTLFLSFLGSLAVTVLKNLGRIKALGFGPLAATVAAFLAQNVYENSLTRSTDYFFVLFILSVSLVARGTLHVSGRDVRARGCNALVAMR